jgi:hypothetical protein
VVLGCEVCALEPRAVPARKLHRGLIRLGWVGPSFLEADASQQTDTAVVMFLPDLYSLVLQERAVVTSGYEPTRRSDWFGLAFARTSNVHAT